MNRRILLILWGLLVGVQPTRVAAQYCTGMCFAPCWDYELGWGHRYDSGGNDDEGFLPHGCGGWPDCHDHPPCWRRLQSLLPDGSLEGYRSLTGEELFSIAEGSEGIVYLNLARRAVQVRECTDPAGVAVTLPLSGMQLAGFLNAQSTHDRAWVLLSS